MWAVRTLIIVLLVAVAWHFWIAHDPASELPMRLAFTVPAALATSWGLHKWLQLI
jgi:hypothetical protein